MFINDILSNKELLNSSLTKKDLKFIEDLDENMRNLQSQIDAYRQIRDSINNMQNHIVLHAFSKFKKNAEFYNSLKKSFECANENIHLLLDREQNIDMLNKSITKLIAHSNSQDKEKTDDSMQTINKQIENTFGLLKNIYKKISENNSILINFFSDKTTQRFLYLLDDKTDYLDILNKNYFSSSSASKLSDDAHEDNNVLIISKYKNKVFLRYRKSEIEMYLKNFPNKYKDFQDVVYKEFIVPLSYYTNSPSVARFREAFYLIREKENKSIIEALKYATYIMPMEKLHPAIVASCVHQYELDHYIDCLNNNRLYEFKYFTIKYDE